MTVNVYQDVVNLRYLMRQHNLVYVDLDLVEMMVNVNYVIRIKL